MEKIFLGENLKLLRSEFGLNQADISKLIGKKGSIIGTYESGTSKPPLESLITISNYFGVDIDSLVRKDLSEICTFRRDEEGNVVVKCSSNCSSDSKSEESLLQIENCTNRSEQKENGYLIAVPNSKSEELGGQMAAEPIAGYYPYRAPEVIMLMQERIEALEKRMQKIEDKKSPDK